MQTTDSSHRPPDDRPDPQLERIAAEWFFRRDRGFAPGEAAAFETWMRTDERHVDALSAIENTWRAFAGARGKIAVPSAAPRRIARARPRLIGISVVLAMAAALAMAYLRGWRPEANPSVMALQAATEIGGLRKIDLPDGSFVTLNTNTAVQVRFTSETRHVQLLRGEAWFEVARNPNRPFVVEARGVAVKAVGTAFNVRLNPELIEVLVTEGKVRVEDAVHGQSLLAAIQPLEGSPLREARDDGPRILTQGEKVLIPVRAGATPIPAVLAAVPPAAIELALAWQNRRLSYVDAPLSEIIADFNRYNQHRLVIVDPRLASRRFGGTFPAGDYHSLVQLLEQTFDVMAERRERETILRLR